MTCAGRLIFFQPYYTTSFDAQNLYEAAKTQAIGRICRYGRTEMVHVYHFVTVGTIDVDLLETRERCIIEELPNIDEDESDFDEQESDIYGDETDVDEDEAGAREDPVQTEVEDSKDEPKPEETTVEPPVSQDSGDEVHANEGETGAGEDEAGVDEDEEDAEYRDPILVKLRYKTGKMVRTNRDLHGKFCSATVDCVMFDDAED